VKGGFAPFLEQVREFASQQQPLVSVVLGGGVQPILKDELDISHLTELSYSWIFH
jgi:hypothetical protein